jgi:pyruvate formate lyase activating enzyme
MKKAEYWHRREDGKTQCDLCPHGCVIAEGKSGTCKVRGTVGGELKALGYGLVSSAGLDPIEKKPLYHFLPGADIFSIGGWGCNLGCSFCQNWTISQQFGQDRDAYTPEWIVRKAAASGSMGIAYTYNEPVVGFEFVRDCSVLARQAGLLNVLVTNGYVRKEPAAELLPLVDATNIDIKSMDDAFYRKQCGATLRPVLDFARQAVQAGVHVEITNLVIPGLNDDDHHFELLAQWMRTHLGETVPLHLSAYHPQYKLDVSPTSPAALQKAHALARKTLLYVYMGNVSTRSGQDTTCPGCGRLLVERRGYATAIKGIDHGRCAGCGRKADFLLKKTTR